MTPNELVLTFGGLHACVQFGENRRRNATVRVSTDGQTHARTDAKRFYYLSHAIAIAMGQIMTKIKSHLLLAVVDKPLVHSLPPMCTGKHLQQYIIRIALIITVITRKHRQSYRHADSRWQRPQYVAQPRIGVRITGHGH